MKLKELTTEQEQKLVEFRAEVFAQATSTEPADRARAEAAARRMAEIGGVKVEKIVWVSTPEQGLSAYDEAWASLIASLDDSLRVSLWDSPWQAFYTFPALHMGVEYAPEAMEKLELHREISASCFAMWLVPGTVILCDRPEAVEVVDGKLISLTWRGQSGRVSK